ncbi:alpha-tocopherol transfer protein-like [Ischnura elegans]|uniref:alpha-tocopherol transfer protein-like n=1 Tax=Ischnura elegans TaxID=197161 RepID=UPI001ED8B133|nr:alpha-tocopherol transfer protein-like [Ischnura elegans]
MGVSGGSPTSRFECTRRLSAADSQCIWNAIAEIGARVGDRFTSNVPLFNCFGDHKMAVRGLVSARPWVADDGQEGGGGDGGIMMVAGYPSLREAVIAVAKKELREDRVSREQALQLMKEWLQKSQDIKNGRLDDAFILRFLRVKKFSVPLAQQTILKYLHFRNIYSHYCRQLDYLEPPVYELLKSGYLFALPQRDKLGRRVIFANAGKLDPYKYHNTDMAKAHLVTYETLLEDEDNQVLGFNHVTDLKGVCAAQMTLWSPSELGAIIKLGEQAVPMRHKEIHFLNVPPAFRMVYDFCKTLFSEKMRNRFYLHSSLEELHQSVDPKILPKEYGGTIPMSEMIDMWMKEVSRKRDALLSLDRMESQKVMHSYKPRTTTPKASNGITSLPGSFRRLEVD